MALMRHLLAQRIACKAGISEGRFADVGGCLPPCVRHRIDETNAIRSGKYIMTFWSVMGTALINAFNLTKMCPSGPLLLLDGRLSVPGTIKVLDHAEGFVNVDWLRSEPPLLAELMQSLGACMETPDQLAKRLRDYVNENPEISAEWKANALRLADGPDSD